MNRKLVALAASFAFLTTVSCSISLLGTPAPFPTSPFSPTQTPLGFTPVAASATSPVPTTLLPTNTAAPAATATGASTGAPSGPYAVIRVIPPDVLNIRSSPDPASAIVGTFSATATTVMRSGGSATFGSETWAEVQNPGGGTGWVNARFLTEYVSSTTFCADGRVNTLLSGLAHALTASDGAQLSSLVSPAHGMDVLLYRYSTPVNYDPAHAAYAFTSTYANDWGTAPGSGLETVGSFHQFVLPGLQDVFNASYTLSCDHVQTGGASYDTSWPAQYTNINFYSAYKPGPSGNELSWRTVLVGVEYVGGQPYVFSLTQMAWEP